MGNVYTAEPRNDSVLGGTVQGFITILRTAMPFKTHELLISGIFPFNSFGPWLTQVTESITMNAGAIPYRMPPHWAVWFPVGRFCLIFCFTSCIFRGFPMQSITQTKKIFNQTYMWEIERNILEQSMLECQRQFYEEAYQDCFRDTGS